MGRDIARVVAVLLLYVVVVYVSHRAGLPPRLPGAALGWRALFHLERAAAVLGSIGLVLLVGWRAMKGEFPIKFGNVEYAVKEAAEKAENATDAQERRLEFVEAILGIGPPPSP